MAIIRWEPFREMVTLREKMNRLFEDAVVGQREEKDLVSSTWSPSVDIFETENEIVLTAELPGIEDKDIEIKLDDNTLTLKGERQLEKETQEENYHRIERSYGSFYRSFTLPNYVDQDKIKAVIGGFHLFDKNITDKTIDYFKTQNINKIHPAHCLDKYAFSEFEKIGARRLRTLMELSFKT